MAGNDTYKLDRIITSDNAVIRVYRPDIAEDEMQKRMKKFKKATADFMAAVYKEEMKRDGRNQIEKTERG